MKEKIFAVAPMMDWTDRHCRVLHRTLTKRTRLYTEMIAANAVIHGDRAKLLGFDAVERPLALQLGGSDPRLLAQAARIAEDLGYDEVNLNCGCPSDRVKSGSFGACLMRAPDLVAECMAAMVAKVAIPVTLKCRIGVDDQDPETSLPAMADACAAAGVTTVIVHARKAWLQGLSPKENRDIPPLDYPLVHRLKAARPGLAVVINGGVASLEAAQAQMRFVDGVMLGRAAYHAPKILGRADRLIFGDLSVDDVGAFEAVEAYKPYVADQLARGTPLAAMTRHMLGLFAGRPGARAWRRVLTTESVRAHAGLDVLDRAVRAVSQAPQPVMELR